MDKLYDYLIRIWKRPDGNYQFSTPDFQNKKVRKIQHLIKKELFVLAFMDKCIRYEQKIENLEQKIENLEKENQKLLEKNWQLMEQNYQQYKLIEEVDEELNELGI